MARAVLVVDDDDDFRDLATRLLREWGHTVVGEAGTVAAALERATELTPDLVLVDVGLPDGDGFTLTRQLRAMAHPPRVVLISSDSDRATVPAAHLAGASAFFRKDEMSDEQFRRCLDPAPRS